MKIQKVVSINPSRGIAFVITENKEGYLVGNTLCPCGACINEEEYQVLRELANETVGLINWVADYNHLDQCDIDKYFPIKRSRFVLRSTTNTPQEVIEAVKEFYVSQENDRKVGLISGIDI